MNLPRIFFNAVARRVAIVLVAVVLGALGIGHARAGTLGCSVASDQCSEGQAVSLAWQEYNSKNFACKHSAELIKENSTAYRVNYKWGNTSPCNSATFTTSYVFVSSKSCAVQPPLSGGWTRVGTAGGTCSDGCMYGLGGGGNSITVNGRTYMSKDGATPTGSVCSGTVEEAGTPVTADDCQTVAGLTQCVTSQGKHCAVASNGKKFCWTPGEAGTKTSGNVSATKSPEGVSASVPSTPPANGGQWQSGSTGTVSVGGSGGTTNYNVTNHTSNYGAEGDGGGAEGDGEGEGEGDGDGEQPEWTKGDEPARDDAGEDDDVTDFGIGISPDLLDREEIFGGGSCPTFPAFSIMGVSVNPTADMPQWCTLVAIMRAAVLIMAAFTALRILTGDGL